MERYRWGVKKPEEIRNFRFDHVHLRAADEGDFKGAPIQLHHNPELNLIVARPAPGVAMRNASGDDFTYFTPDDIQSGRWKEHNVDWHRGIMFFGPDDTVEHLRSVLEAEGIKPTKFRPLVPPGESVRVTQEFAITDLMRRAVAKIGFNYMAYRQGADFALLHEFDPLRLFIREGEEPPLPPVHSTMDLPFRSSAPEDQRPVVHWVELTGHRSHPNLLASVMLFGFMNHVIMLAQDFPGPWPELPLAHVYNPKTLTVREMQPAKPRWRHANRRNP